MSTNPWIAHVKKYAADNNISYSCAVSMENFLFCPGKFPPWPKIEFWAGPIPSQEIFGKKNEKKQNQNPLF